MTSLPTSPSPVSLVLGDCLVALAGYPDDYFSAVVTDPPYGLEFMGREFDKPWAVGVTETGYTDAVRMPRPSFGSNRNPVCRRCHKHKRGRDTCQCGKPDWDETPTDSSRAYGEWCLTWTPEVLRVLKPGGHALFAGIGRTHHRMMVALEDAGFELRDCIYHLFGSGFPKSLSPSLVFEESLCDRAGDKWRYRSDGQEMSRTPPFRHPLADEWAGYGTALKPAAEIWVLARKPLSEPNVAANVVRHGTGAVNVDACRVATADSLARPACYYLNGATNAHMESRPWMEDRRAAGDPIRPATPGSTLGRWPPNVLLSHHPACVYVGTKEVKSDGHHPAHRGAGTKGYHGWPTGTEGGGRNMSDPSGHEVVSDWECRPDCPVNLLDGQAGQRRSSGTFDARDHSPGKENLVTSFGNPGVPATMYADHGSASRFFPVFPPDDATRFRYQSKPSKRERNLGCSSLYWATDSTRPSGYRPITEAEWVALGDDEERVHKETGKRVALRAAGNIHPTVKGRNLCSWLVRLVCPPGGVILDPFAGTGTTGLAAMDEGASAILVERDPDYHRIAEARLAAWEPRADKIAIRRTMPAKSPTTPSVSAKADQVAQVGLWEATQL